MFAALSRLVAAPSAPPDSEPLPDGPLSASSHIERMAALAAAKAGAARDLEAAKSDAQARIERAEREHGERIAAAELEASTAHERLKAAMLREWQATAEPLLVQWAAESYPAALTAPIRDAWRRLVERARVELGEKPGAHVIATSLALLVVEERQGVLALKWRDHWMTNDELTRAGIAVLRANEGHLVEWARALEEAVSAALAAAGSRVPTDEDVERFHAVRTHALTDADAHRVEGEVIEAFERERRATARRGDAARDAKYPNGWMVSDGRVLPRRSGQGALVTSGTAPPR